MEELYPRFMLGFHPQVVLVFHRRGVLIFHPRGVSGVHLSPGFAGFYPRGALRTVKPSNTTGVGHETVFERPLLWCVITR